MLTHQVCFICKKIGVVHYFSKDVYIGYSCNDCLCSVSIYLDQAVLYFDVNEFIRGKVLIIDQNIFIGNRNKEIFLIDFCLDFDNFDSIKNTVRRFEKLQAFK